MAVRPTYCQFCGEELDLGSAFVFLVEVDHLAEQSELWWYIQENPRYLGEPLRLCKRCRTSVEENEAALAEEQRCIEVSRQRANRLYWLGCLLAVAIPATVFILGLMAAAWR